MCKQVLPKVVLLNFASLVIANAQKLQIHDNQNWPKLRYLATKTAKMQFLKIAGNPQYYCVKLKRGALGVRRYAQPKKNRRKV